MAAPTGSTIRAVKHCVEFTTPVTAEGIRSYTREPVGFIRTTTFTLLGVNWHVRVHLNGVDGNEGCVSVMVAMETPGITVKLSRVSMRVVSKGKTVGAVKEKKDLVLSTEVPFKTGHIDMSSGCWGWPKFLKHSDILANKGDYIPDGVLAVELKLSPMFLPDVIRAPPSNMGDQLHGLLQSGDGADVTLLCGGESFRAHSIILSARSRVFGAQLSPGSPFTGVDLSAVSTPPELTPSALRAVLEFVYTDAVSPMTAEDAQNLLFAADHYDLTRLMKICEETLCNSVTAENSALTLSLAEKHSAVGLKKFILRYMAENTAEVMKTEGWKQMVDSSPRLVAELLAVVVSRGGSSATAVPEKRKRGMFER